MPCSSSSRTMAFFCAAFDQVFKKLIHERIFFDERFAREVFDGFGGEFAVAAMNWVRSRTIFADTLAT